MEFLQGFLGAIIGITLVIIILIIVIVSKIKKSGVAKTVTFKRIK